MSQKAPLQPVPWQGATGACDQSLTLGDKGPWSSQACSQVGWGTSAPSPFCKHDREPKRCHVIMYEDRVNEVHG